MHDPSVTAVQCQRAVLSERTPAQRCPMSLLDELRALGCGVPEPSLNIAAILFWENGVTRSAELWGVTLEDLDCSGHPRDIRNHIRTIMHAAEAAARRGVNARMRSRSPAPQANSAECPVETALVHIKTFSRAAAVQSGPCRAIASVAAALPRECSARRVWCEIERIRAVLQPCARSLASVRSGLRCYRAFCVKVLLLARAVMPPRAEILAAWASLFRCADTLGNYLGYLRTGCLLLNVDVSVFSAPLVRRAKAAARARRDYVSRPKQFLGIKEVALLLKLAKRDPSLRMPAMLFLFAYIFLARVPSEALPVVRREGVAQPLLDQSAVVVGHDTITLHLARRKNKAAGSVLVRTCWCSTNAACCPVHVLGPFLCEHECGMLVFPCSAADALRVLRRMCLAAELPRAETVRTHDFRRGHARDLQRLGKSLAEILRAGEWKSCAFLTYLDEHELECEAVIEAHVLESDSECDMA